MELLIGVGALFLWNESKRHVMFANKHVPKSGLVWFGCEATNKQTCDELWWLGAENRIREGLNTQHKQKCSSLWTLMLWWECSNPHSRPVPQPLQRLPLRPAFRSLLLCLCLNSSLQRVLLFCFFWWINWIQCVWVCVRYY